MKSIFRVLLSKIFLFGILAVGQILFFVLFFTALGGIASEVYTFLTLFSLIAGIIVFERDSLNPAYKLLWMFAFAIFPVTSGLMYLATGRQVLSKGNHAHFENIVNLNIKQMPDDTKHMDFLEKKDSHLARSAAYLRAQANSPLYNNTQSTFFKTGDDFFVEFIKQLKQAKKSVFMEYFIINEEGTMWPHTLDILKQKAAEGLDIRIVYDCFGSLFTLPIDYDQMLQGFGIKSFGFNTIKPSVHFNDYLILNNRDHRKICVIDDEIGFTGGINFSDEYINLTSPFGVWKDSALMIKGPAVYGLTTTFLSMWQFLSEDKIDFESHIPTTSYPEYKDCLIQPYCDTPISPENVSEYAYFNIINNATKYVYITTPYLVIDNEMLTTLQLTSKSGVDVRIILPSIPDKWYVFMLTQSYYKPLLKAGVKIYEFAPGFIHSKMYVSDDTNAIIGSANMDYRSLYLHFENCCAFYGGEIVNDVKQDMLNTIAQCNEITIDNIKTNIFKRVFQLCMRIFAPLM